MAPMRTTGNADADLLPSGDRVSCFNSHMGVWLMEPNALEQRVNEIKARLAHERPIDATAAMRVEIHRGPGFSRSKAVIPVHGSITKKRSKFAETSALEARQAVRDMRNDPSVSTIVLHIDSPGGSIAGIDDLAAEVRETVKTKPVIAVCEDLCASAAYWIASQASEIVANRSAFVGSLGAYCVVQDTSGMYERNGVKVHVVSSGGVKGAGTPGSEVTDEALSASQDMIDAVTNLFKLNVQSGRGLTTEETSALFDGRVFSAQEAIRLGLVDRISTLDAVLAEDEEMPEDEKREDEAPERDEDEEEESKAQEDEPEEENESEEEDEEEEMKESKALDAAELNADLDSLVESVKADGCPLAENSIRAKLARAASSAKDNDEALILASKKAESLREMSPIAGGFAEKETASKTSEAPRGDHKSLARQWRKVFKAKCEEIGDPTRALVEAKEENPELHAAFIKASTDVWNDRYARGMVSR